MEKGEVAKNWTDKWLEIRHWAVKNWENIEAKKVGTTDLEYPTQDETQIPF